MANLPLSPAWRDDYFASPIPGYITYVAVSISFLTHPILFALHTYRKFFKDDDKTGSKSPSENTMTAKSIRARGGSKSMRARGGSKSSRARTARDIFKTRTDKEKIVIIRNIATITTLSSLVFGVIASIITLVNQTGDFSSPKTCAPIAMLQNICWIVTKLTIYQVLILKLQAAFWGSVHEYNRTFMLSSYIFVTLVSLICIIGTIIEEIGVTALHATELDIPEGWCFWIIPTWLILLPCALDIICSTAATIMFIRVLNKLLAMNKDNIAHNNKLLGVTILMTKLIWLTIIAVVSNLFGGIFFAITDIALFTYLDTVINPICLILMEASNNDIYKFFCKYCHIGMHKIVHSKRPDVAAKPFIDLETEENKKKMIRDKSKEETVTIERTGSIDVGSGGGTETTDIGGDTQMTPQLTPQMTPPAETRQEVTYQ